MANPSIESACSHCGGRRVGSSSTCSFCRSDAGFVSVADLPIARTVHDAATAWARAVFGAPRAFASLITRIDVRDHEFQRIATEIVRREVREVRVPSSQGRTSRPRVTPTSVDPYAISAEALRADSEYIAACTYCNGGGNAPCNACAATGRQACGHCQGSGKEVRYYQKSSRVVKCSVCKGGCTIQAHVDVHRVAFARALGFPLPVGTSGRGVRTRGVTREAVRLF
jgi:hypothetical protein